jgi:integrase
MSKANGSEIKFTKLVLEPRKRVVRVHCTPNRGRDYYTVSYYDEYGHRQRRVFPRRSLAEKETERLRRKLDNGSLPGLLIAGRDRMVYERALEFATKAKTDLDILARDAAEARAILGTVSLTDAARYYVENQANVIEKSVAEVVAELVVDRVKNDKSPLYIRDLKKRLGNFAEAFKCPISSVGVKQIEIYLDHTGPTGRYRKNIISTIGTLLGFARNRGYVQRDHPGVAPITKPANKPRDIRVLTPAECRQLLLGITQKVVPAAAIGFFTGLRSAEIDRLDWKQIKLDEGHIEVFARNAKKKVRRIVPVAANLKAWLRPFEQRERTSTLARCLAMLKLSRVSWTSVSSRSSCCSGVKILGTMPKSTTLLQGNQVPFAGSPGQTHLSSAIES